MSADEKTFDQLWELVYGLLPDDEAAALCERIESEPDLARAYATVKLQSDRLADAARLDQLEPQKPGEWPQVLGEWPQVLGEWKDEPRSDQQETFVTRNVNERTLSRSSLFGKRPALRMVMAVAATLFLGLATWSVVQRDSPEVVMVAAQATEIQTSLILPDTFQREISNPVVVKVRGQRSPTPLDFRIYDSDDNLQVHRQVSTNEKGFSRVELPGRDLPAQGRIEVVPLDNAAIGVTADLSVASNDASTYFSVDKSYYRPGEVVAFRSVTLPRFAAVDQEAKKVVVELQDSIGNTIQNGAQTIQSENGVANGSFDIPLDALEGSYQLVTGPDADDSRHAIDVRRSDALLAKAMSGGAALEGGGVTTAQTQIDFYPEGGDLVAGVRNRVYFHAHDSGRQPIELNGQVVDGQNRVLAVVQTQYRGRGHFSLLPLPKQNYWFVARIGDDPETRFQLPTAVSEGVAIQTNGNVFSDKTPIQVELRARRPHRSLVLAASCKQAIVGLEQIDDDEFQPSSGGQVAVQRTIQVVPQTNGVVHVTLFDGSVNPPQALADRIVFFRPKQHIQVQVNLPDGNYQPGQQITLSLLTTDEEGVPQSAFLDASLVLQESEGTPQNDALGIARNSEPLPTHLYLAEELGEGTLLQGDCDWGQTTEPEQALDLLLATQSGPGFENSVSPANTLSFATEFDEAKEALGEGTRSEDEALRRRSLARANLPTPKIVFSNSVLSSPRDFSNVSQVSGRLHRFAPVAIVASMLLGLLLVLDAVLPYVGRRVAAFSLAGLAVAVLLVGGFWLGPDKSQTAAISNAVVSEEAFLAAPSKEDRAESVAQPVHSESPSPIEALIEEDVPLAAKGASTPPTAPAFDRFEQSSGPFEVERQRLESPGLTQESASGRGGDSGLREAVPPTDPRLTKQRDLNLAIGGQTGELATQSLQSAAGDGEGQRLDRVFRKVIQLKQKNRAASADAAIEKQNMRTGESVLITDANGRATVTLQLPPQQGVVKLRLDAQSAGRLGSIEKTIVVGQ